MPNLSDKKLIDWLAARMYVEATNSGAEDKKRFMFQGAFDGDFREALSAHIQGAPRHDDTKDWKPVKVFP